MADQVNLIGGLSPGASQTLSSASSPQRSAPPPAPAASGPTGEPGSVRPGSDAPKASKESLKKAADQVAAAVNESQSDVRFMVDQSTGQYYFKIVDAATHKTIRQVPSEEVLAMAQRLQQFTDGKSVKGLLVDAKG